MKKTDLAYMAGMIDGDGSIVISTNKSRKSLAGQMKACACNSNKDVLLFMQLHFGGYICASNSHLKYPWQKPQYQWTVASQKALVFLEAISPFLRIKKAQAEIAMTFQRQRRNKGCKLTEEEKAVAEAQRIVMAKLNKKGVH